MSRICRVDDYLGGGEYLEISDSLKKMLNEAWYYYPYDFYTGVFSGGEFSISHVYEAASAVKVEVTDIRLIGEDGRVTLKLTAGCDTEVFVSAMSYQSDDNLGSTDRMIGGGLLKRQKPSTGALCKHMRGFSDLPPGLIRRGRTPEEPL